jgi:arginine:ornithine antiporter/lysine permease
VVTSLGVQGLLALTLFVNDALNFMLDLSTSLALLPYLLAAAYALKLGLVGDSYEGVTAGQRRKETVVAGIATAYTIFLFDAAGMKFVLLAALILAPASLLYVKARSEHGRRLFTPAEIGLLVLIVVGAALATGGLWTGWITI